MAKLSAFADEISPEAEVQIAELKKNGVGFIELRGLRGKNVMALTDAEVREFKKMASDAGIGFSAVGSPIGKYPIDGKLEEQIDLTKRAIEIAGMIGAPYVRIFSFFPPQGGDILKFEGRVMEWLGALCKVAEPTAIKLAHENEARIFGEKGAECLKIHQAVKSPALVGVFDPANYAVAGENVWECWEKVRPYIRYFHIKDYSRARKMIVPAGEGDGDIPRILKDAASRGFDSFLTLEPHLSKAAASYGVTSPELFATAVRALRGVMAGAGMKG